MNLVALAFPSLAHEISRLLDLISLTAGLFYSTSGPSPIPFLFVPIRTFEVKFYYFLFKPAFSVFVTIHIETTTTTHPWLFVTTCYRQKWSRYFGYRVLWVLISFVGSLAKLNQTDSFILNKTH